jgi:hypothetical protein
MTMTEPASPDATPRHRTPLHPLLLAGVTVMLAAVAWWLSYYSAYGGWFGVLDVKYLCLSGWMEDCNHIQAQIGSGFLPAYTPFAWWAGTLLMLVGLYLTMRNRRN